MDFDWFRYWWPCVFLGLGIAIDVAMATVTQYRNPRLTFWKWTVPVAGMHIVAPAIGYYGFWIVILIFPKMEPILGVVGCAIVTAFLYAEVCKKIGVEPVFDISEWAAKKCHVAADDVRHVMLMIAVTWDALWSGPAKALTALAEKWTASEVGWSFVIAGAVVAIIAEIARYAAYKMRKRKHIDARGRARFNVRGTYVEFSVIGGFGVLALWQGLFGEAMLSVSIVIAAALLAVVFFWFRKELMENELSEAAEAIE